MQQVSFEFDLGQQVEHKITGFSGTVMGQALYYSGCIQYLVKPRMSEEDQKSNKIPDGEWLDEATLVALDQSAHEPAKVVGGPQEHPPVR